MSKPSVGILHYTAPPIIGGVEAVIKAQVEEFTRLGYPCTVIAGRGNQAALPAKSHFVDLPEIDSRFPEVVQINRQLETGELPDSFYAFEERLQGLLQPLVGGMDNLIVHNVFTKHFNLPLTGALNRLLNEGVLRNCIAWCHDFTWTSPGSRSKVFPGYPWDLLRKKLTGCRYVTVSRERQHALANLFNCPLEQIRVVYNGVNPVSTLGLSEKGSRLIAKLGLMQNGLNLLMPVRVTQAKNIEFALQVTAELVELGQDPRTVITGPPDPHNPDSMEYYHSLVDLRTRQAKRPRI